MAKDQFNPTALSDQGFKLAEFMPVGKAWDAKNDSATNLGALLLALGEEFHRIESLTQLTNEELDINFAEQLLREWELSVGIPDACFEIDGTNAERRIQIISKLRNTILHTVDDYVSFAAQFGIVVRVAPGVPDGTTATDKEKRFSITVQLQGLFSDYIFPFTTSLFPIPFTAKISSLMQCLFEKLKPAHVQIIMEYGAFEVVFGTLDGTIDQLTGIIDGVSVIFFGTLTGSIAADEITGAFVGILNPGGVLEGIVDQLTGTMLGAGVSYVGTVTGDIGQLSGTINGISITVFGDLNGDIGQLSGTLSANISGLLWDSLPGNWDDLSNSWDDL